MMSKTEFLECVYNSELKKLNSKVPKGTPLSYLCRNNRKFAAAAYLLGHLEHDPNLMEECKHSVGAIFLSEDTGGVLSVKDIWSLLPEDDVPAPIKTLL